MDPEEVKFTKSKTNRATEGRALEVLLLDDRFRKVDTPTKRRLLELLGLKGDYGAQSFDAIMLEDAPPVVNADNIDELTGRVRLVELKATRKPIQDRRLNGFFFGATAREYALAEALGDRLLFAFCVLNEANLYGKPFFVLLTLKELEERTRSRRIQYQVNLRTDVGFHELGDSGLGPHSDYVSSPTVSAEEPPPYRVETPDAH